MARVQAGTVSCSERVRQLAELWRAALGRPQHPAGCSCMGHALIPTMNALDVEDDILDYLRGRYAAEGISSLVRLLDQRRAQHEAGSPLPFGTWLLRLPEQDVDRSALDRLLTDLLATLASFESNHRTHPR